MTVKAYQEHPIRTSVNRILAMQNSPEFSSEAITANDAYVFAINKTFAITQVLSDLLETTPAELVNNTTLGQLNNNIHAPLNELTAFISDKNAGHLTNAAAQVEGNILPLLHAFAPPVQRTAKKSFPAILDAQASSAKIIIEELRSQRDQLSSDLATLRSTAAELSKNLQELKDSATTERAEAAAAVAKLEQTFTTRETERQTKFENAVADSKNKFDEERTAVANSAEKLVKELEQHRDNAAKIVQVVGNIGVTGNYQQIANKEGQQADRWRLITIGIFALGLIVASATFIKFWGQPLTPETGLAVFVRLLYAIAITTPAWYTARESARHRTNSDRARQTELELASLGPFIELLPDDKKVEIRDRMTSQYFGRAVDTHVVNSPFDPIVIKDLAAELAKAVKA